MWEKLRVMITVMRYGHRPERDKRTTTHVGLVARAFGADKFLVTGAYSNPVNTVNDISNRWGGEFKADLIKNWRGFLRNFKGITIHLTMYGEPLKNAIEKIHKKSSTNYLIFVGAEKVPADVYDLCDFNVAVGNQPHSEIGALSIFLDRLTRGEWENKGFEGGRLKIIPQEKGKKMETF